MPTFEGAYIKPWLRLYFETNGQPTDDDKQRLIAKYPELATTVSNKNQPDQAQPQQTESATDTESSTETQTETATGTQPSTSNDLPKLPDNLDPAIRKQLEQRLKNR
jgi:hypothetical protein